MSKRNPPTLKQPMSKRFKFDKSELQWFGKSAQWNFVKNIQEHQSQNKETDWTQPCLFKNETDCSWPLILGKCEHISKSTESRTS